VNTETVSANKSNYLYLGYENVYDVSVTDLVTGYSVLSDGHSNTNEVEVFSQSTPSVFNRDYSVSYRVRDSYALDNDFYSDTNDQYVTKIYFDSTPNQYYEYEVTYESSLIESSTPISLNVDPMQLWDNEGFVYLSHSDYAFDAIEANLSPEYITDDADDFMYLSVYSLDENENPKPYQTFTVSSASVQSIEQYHTTDINGFSSVKLYYSGSIPSSSTSGTITLSGVEDGSVNAHENSQTEGFSLTITFDIVSSYVNNVELKAIAQVPAIETDGFASNYVNGILLSGSTPSSNKVIYWRKGNNLYEVFEATPYGDYVRTDDYGKFSIGPFISGQNSNPGIRFVSVETEDSATVNTTPTTIAGDITYWYEKYDNLNYFYENSVLFDNNVLYSQSILPIMSTPNFTVKYHDGEYATPYLATPNWLPPKWYPIDRYTQYLMGLLGSTPYYINSYVNKFNEYEED